MPDETVVAAPPAEGVPGQTPGSQDSAPASQDAGQNQDAGQPQGRADGTDASSDGNKEKPSYYYENRKLNSTVRQLQTTIQQMQQQQQEILQKFNQPSVPMPGNQPGWKDPNTIFAKPVETLEELRQSILQELTGKTKETYEQLNQQNERQRQMQEAGNLLLQNDSVRKNPHGKEIIEDILSDPDYRLNEMSQMYPVQAAKLVLAIYNSKVNGQGARNLAAPTKGQMVSTATGAVPGRPANFNAEFTKLQQELEGNNKLATNPEWMKRFNEIKTAWKQQQYSKSQ